MTVSDGLTTPIPEETMQASPTETADVVVVGCGSAAFAAAVASRECGAERVVMLEKAPESDFGGNPRWSHSGFRWVQGGAEEVREFLPDLDEAEFQKAVLKPYEPEDFKRHLGQATRGRMDPVILDAIVGDSNAALHWLRDVGLKWQLDLKLEIEGKFYFEPGYSIHPVGGGLGQLNQFRDIATSRGIDIRFESGVTGLHGNPREIEGVQVAGLDGTYDLMAPVVILCAGGFQASPELRARYLAPNADLMKVRGSLYNTGEVLQLAIAMGAGTSGQWGLGHSSLVSADGPQANLIGRQYSRYSYPYGISVNTEGRRYCDEGENFRMVTYNVMGWKALAQPNGMAWQIFDNKVNNHRGDSLLRTGYFAGGESYEADTIQDLAAQIGLNAEVLDHTVGKYNASLANGDAEFDPTRLDGKRTVGLEPPKSNWATAIDEPPFMAFPVTAGITFTFGGLSVSENAEVLNTNREPIRGLYASGDIMGIFYHGYVGSTGQTRNVVFSRRAAAHAMSQT
jgi:tricarballylate dehydrogenase